MFNQAAFTSNEGANFSAKCCRNQWTTAAKTVSVKRIGMDLWVVQMFRGFSTQGLKSSKSTNQEKLLKEEVNQWRILILAQPQFESNLSMNKQTLWVWSSSSVAENDASLTAEMKQKAQTERNLPPRGQAQSRLKHSHFSLLPGGF